jgi:hypothetical protein
VKYLICGIDRVLADTREREEAARATGYPREGAGSEIYRHELFREDLLRQAKPILGAADTLVRFASAGWYVIWLTDRPTVREDVTWDWLSEHGFCEYNSRLVMKPVSLQTLPTPCWKATVVNALVAALPHQEDEAVYVVDSDLDGSLSEIARVCNDVQQIRFFPTLPDLERYDECLETLAAATSGRNEADAERRGEGENEDTDEK